jgi:DNA-binding winged helix-turn-helix (wHTH) protein
MTRVWPGVFVEDVSLRVHIAALRKALDSGEAGPRYLTNVPGRGYCLGVPIARALIESVDQATDLLFDAVSRLPPPLARMVGRDDQTSIFW